MLDLNQLNSLEKDRQSGVVKVKTSVHVALNPRYISRLHKGIFHYFSKQVGKFHPSLKGILLGHGKIFLKSRQGALLHEDANIHLDVVSDFWVFRPDVGKEIRGVVNKKSINHVSLLVHKSFNISCPRELDLESWQGEYVKIGQAVLVKIKRANYSQNIPDLVGSLISPIKAEPNEATEDDNQEKMEIKQESFASNEKTASKKEKKQTKKKKQTLDNQKFLEQ